jgi:hypothetical protein
VEAEGPNWSGSVSSATSPAARHWLACPKPTGSIC